MFSIISSEAKEISDAAGEYFKNNRPSLMFFHFPDLDEEGHKNGRESEEQVAAMKNVLIVRFVHYDFVI